MKFRIIPRLEVKNNFLIKGMRMEGLKKIGCPIQFAKKYGLNSVRECDVYPKPNKVPHRILLEFSRTKNKQIINESLVIEMAGRHNYSDDYKKLTREFYTIFE